MTAKAKTKKVPLTEPFKIGETEIKELTLRRPTPGDLRGVAVAQLGILDADTFYEFLPRIVSPVLTEDQIVENMDVVDLLTCMKEVDGFFAGK